MTEIEEELILEVNSETLSFNTTTTKDNIHIANVTLTNAQAATLAWLINHPQGTILELQLKKK